MLLFVYILLSLALIWFVSEKEVKIPFSAVVILAFCLRIFVTLVFLTSKSNDLYSFYLHGQYLFEKNPEYPVDYFPFISYLGLLAVYIKDYLHPFIFLKIVFTLFDVAILFPIYFLSKKNRQTALIYALNPISIIVINIHGQMESIPLFFFLSGLVFFLKNRILTSIISLSFGIYTKQWPLLFIIPVLKKTKKKFLLVGLALFPILLTVFHTLFFPISLIDIFTRIKNYRGIFGAWGLSKIVDYLAEYNLNPIIKLLMKRVFLLGFLVFSYVWNEKNILKNILQIMLFFFVFTPTFGIQWLTWLVPFIIIVRPKLWRTFIFVTSIYIAAGFAWDAYQYFRDIITMWNGVVNRIGFLLWLLIIIMFIKNVFYQTTEGEKNRR